MNARRKQVSVLLGVHGAGKSSIGKILANRSQFSYYDEIGFRLRRSVNCSVIESCFLFDKEVMLLESERDRILGQDDRIPVVESWHIGNIAFALARKNMPIANEYLTFLENSLCYFDPKVAIIDIDDGTFRRRFSEQGGDCEAVLAFYGVVREHILSLVRRFELNCLPINGTNDVSLNAEYLGRWLLSEEG